MKILSVLIMAAREGSPAVQLASSYSLDDISFWYRSSVKEVAMFVSREVVTRSKPGAMLSVEHKEYMCHVRVCANNLSVAVLADQEYPGRVAFALIQEVLDLFNKAYNESQWTKFTSDTSLSLTGLDPIIAKYQKPEEADKIMKIQKELDETTTILKKNIDQLLNRGEKLETLAAQSADLSYQSKAFMQQSEKLNSCCSIL
jgi:synaptobrevin family protein YKT6